MTWKSSRLGDVSSIMAGYGFPIALQGKKSGKYPFYKVGDISKNLARGDIMLRSADNYIDEGELAMLKGKLMPEKTLVFAKIGEAIKLNRRAIVSAPCLVDNNVMGIKANPHILDDKYLYYFFLTIKLADLSRATTVPSIRKSDIENILITHPNIYEQEKIVGKIEELFSEIDEADGLLKRSNNGTSFYKRLKKSQLIVDRALPAIPLCEIVERIQIGPFGSQLHKHDYVENGIPLINPANISNGKVMPNFKKSVSREKYLELPMYHLAEGDVILGRRGEMGRSALVTDAENGWFCGTGSIFIRPDSKKIRAAYLAELLSTEYAIAYLENEAGGTTMNNLNKKILSNFPVPLPSIEKQDEILLEIEALKTEISMMNKVISSSINNSTLLKQTILSKAFKGELV